MLPKSQRLSTNRLDYLFRKGNKLKSQYFIIKFLPTEQAHCRFSVSVSTTICKKAVDRNRLRRQIYQSIQNNRAVIEKPHDIFIITLPTIKTIETFSTIEKNILATLKTIN